MSSAPSYTGSPALGVALLGAAETNLQVPTQAVDVLTGGASGTKVDEIVIQAAMTNLTTNIAAGLVYLFLYDGVTHSLWDVIQFTTPTVPSATQAPFRTRVPYGRLYLPSNSWKLRASQSVAANASLLKCFAIGGNF